LFLTFLPHGIGASGESRRFGPVGKTGWKQPKTIRKRLFPLIRAYGTEVMFEQPHTLAHD